MILYYLIISPVRMNLIVYSNNTDNNHDNDTNNMIVYIYMYIYIYICIYIYTLCIVSMNSI